ncbi:hypothetical protein HYT84_01410 [Candidatus Micrarchaeota archaeon]|nr:hypothetical protein [Candidatus Micrarchaeota archaeon]
MKREIDLKNWKEVVKNRFPEIYNSQEHETIYSFLFDFLECVEKKHKDNDEKFLMKAYCFAEDCYNSKSDEIRNAIGVAFYEHVTNDEKMFVGCFDYISKEIMETTVLPLVQFRLHDFNKARLRKFLSLAKERYGELKFDEL